MKIRFERSVAAQKAPDLAVFFPQILNMQSHASPIDPHLNRFLCDVLVDLGGGELVETM